LRETRIAIEQPPQCSDVTRGGGDDRVPRVPSAVGFEFDRLDHLPSPSGAIDKGLQPGPAVESVRTSHHQLRIVQREGHWLGAVVVGLHLRDGGRMASAKPVAELPGLASELIEIGTGRKRASGRGHDELLPGRAPAGRRPVSARSGRKEFIERLIVG
jgi:hypothetical protein